MVQPPRKVPVPLSHRCPVCNYPQTKLQRRLDGTARGSIIYVCCRAEQCSLGMNLAKLETWVAV